MLSSMAGFLLWCWIKFHCMYILHIVSVLPSVNIYVAFTSWVLWIMLQWTLSCVSLQSSFHFFCIHTRNWDHWVRKVFLLLILWGDAIPFYSSCTILHSHPQVYKGSSCPLVHIFDNPTCITFWYCHCHRDEVIFHHVFIFNLSAWSEMLSTFSYTFWPFVCLWETTQVLCPFIQSVFLVSFLFNYLIEVCLTYK